MIQNLNFVKEILKQNNLSFDSLSDSALSDIYSDFMYLLEDSEEEISPEFGKDIIKKYSDIALDDACLYQELMELVYPIELIYYGMNNKIDDYILLGNKIINGFY